MKRKLQLCLLALAVGMSPGLVLAGESDQVDELAKATDLTQRQVRMLLGNRTPYAEYRYTFDRVEQKFVEVMGEVRYRELLAGKVVEFEAEVDGRRVAFVVQLEPRT